jgi:hypothetical protein
MNHRKITTKPCSHCGQEYGSSRKDSKYCSRKCSNDANHAKRNLHPGLGAVKRNDDWWKTFGVRTVCQS